jgi:catechol 2,3-dioxygenase-like lactoylglutathione lyase family enzyme
MSIFALVLVKTICADLERSAAFYDLLGFQPLGPASEAPSAEGAKVYGPAMAVKKSQHLQLGEPGRGLRLELIELRGARPPVPAGPGSTFLTLRTSNIHEDYERLSGLGVTFVGPPVEFPGGPPTMWLVNLTDPDGAVIQLAEFRKAAA